MKYYYFLPLFILTAIGSIGFLHPDEQYYTLDFALFKAGYLKSLSSWEFESEIRPWLLPGLYSLLLQPLKIIGLKDPFIISTILRVATGVFSWFSLSHFSKIMNVHHTSKKLPISLLSFFVIIFMSVRTSSENVATSFFLLAITQLVLANFPKKMIPNKHLLFAGFLLGISFSIRHQLGIMALSLGLWILLTQRLSLKDWLIKFSLPLFFGVSIGIFSDFWGYEKVTFTAWNYLQENLLRDKISSFGVSPWWYYFKLITVKLSPLFGLPLLFLTLNDFKKRKSSWEVWTILPFFLFHCLIGHKELRFLYPILPLALMLSMKQIRSAKILKSLIIFNIFALLLVIFKPAYTPLTFYKFIYHYKKDQPLTLFIFKDRKGRFPSLEMDFYKRENLTMLKQESFNTLSSKEPFHTFTTKYSDLVKLNKLYKCEQKFLAYPKWLLKYNFFKWRERSSIWALSSCHQSLTDKK